MQNKMTNKEYSEYVKTKTPKSPVFTDCLKAFFVGGLICITGECFLRMYAFFGLDEKSASLASSITLIFLSALLTCLDIYPKIGKFAGAGSLVPITGFANSVVAPAIEAKPEGLILGVGAKVFSVSGPVILFGVISSMIAGVIYFIFG